MRREQRILVHQVHPAKLAVDIGTSLVSDWLLWRHCLAAGLAVRYLPPGVVSGLVLRFTDFDGLARSPAGRYVRRHMPSRAVAIRLADVRLWK
jgi:hypothetical protein